MNLIEIHRVPSNARIKHRSEKVDYHISIENCGY